MKNYSLLFITFFLSACAEPGLPEASQMGNDTFGCLIDDQLWLPNNYNAIFFGSVAHEASYIRATQEILITAQQYTKATGLNGFSFLCNASNPNQITLDSGLYTGGFYYTKDDTYTPTMSTPSWHVSRFDTLNRIVSGTFSMHLLGQRNHRPITITQGIFDLKLKMQ